MITLKSIIDWFKGNKYELLPIDFDVKRLDDDNSFQIEIHNDEKTEMKFVVIVLEKYLGLSKKDAINIMLEIHTKGKTIITGYDKNTANRLVSHIESMAKINSFPLVCNVQKTYQDI